MHSCTLCDSRHLFSPHLCFVYVLFFTQVRCTYRLHVRHKCAYESPASVRTQWYSQTVFNSITCRMKKENRLHINSEPDLDTQHRISELQPEDDCRCRAYFIYTSQTLFSLRAMIQYGIFLLSFYYLISCSKYFFERLKIVIQLAL